LLEILEGDLLRNSLQLDDLVEELPVLCVLHNQIQFVGSLLNLKFVIKGFLRI